MRTLRSLALSCALIVSLLPGASIAGPLLPELGRPGGPFHLLPGPTTALPWREHSLLSTGGGHDGLPTEAYVIPQRPGQNQVRYFDFNWRSFDYLDDDGSAGVRMYFYDREYPIARIAAGLVRESWTYLEDRFHYKPSFKVPYILYNSYREFLQTNVFQVQEGVLGVTSPQDLRMTLPYFGERELFKLVTTHEMTHQFQIQKVAERAQSAGVDNPIGAFPLWFTEGLAEYYAHNQGIDPETEMFLRDIVLNPIGEVGYDIPTLDEDRPGSYLYTYKYGQAKLTFLAETYGERVIQAVLDQSPRLAGRRGEPREAFQALLGRIAGEQPEQMNARWITWLRHRVLPAYLNARQDLPDVTELKLPDELDWFVSSRDGNLLFYRGVERESARAKLVLIDRRDPTSAQQLAIDQHPGTESLHPVLRSVMAVCDTGVAWFAQSGDSDVLHYRPLHRGEEKDPDTGRHLIDLDLGTDRELHIVDQGLIEAGDPSFSPDGKRLAFYGLDRSGKIDLYVLDLNQPGIQLKRLTNDLYSERDISWGEDGIVYASDATDSGKYNLFRIDPDTGVRERLTDAPVDHRFPVALAGKAVVYASDAGGKTDLWFLQNNHQRRLSDFATALSHPGISPNGLYGVAFYGARFRLFELPTADLLSLDEQEAIAPGTLLAQAHPFPDENIPRDAPPYDPLQLSKNWRIEGGGAAIGGGGIGYVPVGQGGVQFADILRDRTFLANLAVYGSFDLTDALALYIDRSHRITYGFGLFDTFQQGRDVSFPSASQCGQPVGFNQQQHACQVFYLQKQFGVQGLASYPLSTYTRLDASAKVQGLSRSLLDGGIIDQFGFATALPNNELQGILGFDPEAELSLDWGYDTTRYALGGAIGGSSILTEVGFGTLPLAPEGKGFVYAQLDAIHTIQIAGRSRIYLRAAGGLAQGSRFGRHFYLSSFDNLRGFRFGDQRLLGDGYYVSQAEFAFPLDAVIRFAFFSNITGIAGIDFGGVVESRLAEQNHPGDSRLRAALVDAWANRTMDYVFGANLGLGPFELRIHFAHGVSIGGLLPETDSSGGSTWVPNVSIHYAYF